MVRYKSLGDINPALVNKHLFSGQRKKEQAAYNNWYSVREQEIKKEEIVEANRTLLSCIKAGADDVHCMNKYVGSYEGLHGGKGAARRAGLGEIKSLAEKGILTETQTDFLLDKKYTHDDGHETTYREQFPKEAAEIEDAVDDRAAAEFTRKQNQNKLDAEADKDAFIAEIDPNQITKEGYRLETIQRMIDKQNEQKLKYNGYSAPYLQTAIDSLNRDKNILKKRQLDMDIMAREGNLNSETLKQFPFALQIKKKT